MSDDQGIGRQNLAWRIDRFYFVLLNQVSIYRVCGGSITRQFRQSEDLQHGESLRFHDAHFTRGEDGEPFLQN